MFQNNKFQEKEIKGRILFYKFLKANKSIHGNIKFTKGEFDGVDAQLTANTNITADVEIKVRSSMKYGDCFLEIFKYNEIMTYSTNKEKLYVAIYPNEGKLVIWNLAKINMDEITKDYQLMNKSYCNDPFYKVYKQVYHLPFDKGKTFSLNLK